MLHVISAQCVARHLHTIPPGPLECVCWRQFAMQWGDCENSRFVPFNTFLPRQSCQCFLPVPKVLLTSSGHCNLYNLKMIFYVILTKWSMKISSRTCCNKNRCLLSHCFNSNFDFTQTLTKLWAFNPFVKLLRNDNSWCCCTKETNTNTCAYHECRIYGSRVKSVNAIIIIIIIITIIIIIKSLSQHGQGFNSTAVWVVWIHSECMIKQEDSLPVSFSICLSFFVSVCLPLCKNILTSVWYKY